MHRNILTAGFAGAILVAFAMLPPVLPGLTASLSGSAQAQKLPDTNAANLNSSRSNIYRGKAPGETPTKKIAKPRPKTERATTVKSSKSNTSD